MKYIITGKNFSSPILKKYKGRAGYIYLTEQELHKSNIEFTKLDKIYAPDETSVPIIVSKIKDQRMKKKIDRIKNKYTCRVLLQDIYSNFYFKKINIDDLKNFNLPKNKKYIVKPQKGFFGTAIREVDNNTDLEKIAMDLKNDIKQASKFFSKDVFTEKDFLIEEFIEGEEYTFDLFYNQKGKPVIVNFCHHPVSGIKEYFHLLYYTNYDIYKKFNEQVINIFTKFNKTLQIKNLPIHAEFRERGGTLIPIEFNIPRFGGFGVADLPFYAFGLNPFNCFFEDKEPNWDGLLKKNRNKYYGWVLCYNGIGINLSKNKPNYEKLKEDLGTVLHFYKLDYKSNPVFGIAYVEKSNKDELNSLLKLDFKNYFIPV